MAGHVTIKDLAAKLRISPSTVSRALSGHPDIASATRRRVMDLAASLDYHPDSIAQSLKNARTKTIGVIVPEIKHDFFASVLDGIEDVTSSAGFSLLVAKSSESYEREVLNTRVLASHRIAGLVASISENTRNSDHFKALEKRQIPLVFFDRVMDDSQVSKVVVNDEEGAFTAVDYLIKKGYRRIAHIGGQQHLSIGFKRFKGYCRALERNGLELNMTGVVFGGFDERDGQRGFDLLDAFKPDALFAVNDPVAIGAMMRIKERGLTIPGDVAVVGFSNNSVAAMVEPPLTTVAQPAYEMGASAARLLMEAIQGINAAREAVTEVLKTELIIRKSA